MEEQISCIEYTKQKTYAETLKELVNDKPYVLIDSSEDQLTEMCEEDDLIPVSEDIINDLRKISS